MCNGAQWKRKSDDIFNGCTELSLDLLRSVEYGVELRKIANSATSFLIVNYIV